MLPIKRRTNSCYQARTESPSIICPAGLIRLSTKTPTDQGTNSVPGFVSMCLGDPGFRQGESQGTIRHALGEPP